MDAKAHRAPVNALRAAAAIWVVVYHFRHYSPYPWFEIPGVDKGYLGVDFFFVLSGLIISHVYLDSMLAKGGLNEYLRFIGLRLARIWPVHALMMGLMLAGALWLQIELTAKDWTDWITLTMLIRQWLLPFGYAWNSPAWSVSAELFAYAFVFPFVVHFAKQKDERMAGLLILGMGIALFLLIASTMGTFNATRGTGPLIRVTGGFLTGAGLYCLLKRKEQSKQWDVAILIGLASLPLSLWSGSDLACLASLILLISGAYMTTGPLGSLLASKPLFLMGEWSFSLYLVHIPLLRTARHFADQWDIQRGVTFCLAALAASAICAAVLNILVETPARKIARRQIERWYRTATVHFPAAKTI